MIKDLLSGRFEDKPISQEGAGKALLLLDIILHRSKIYKHAFGGWFDVVIDDYFVTISEDDKELYTLAERKYQEQKQHGK